MFVVYVESHLKSRQVIFLASSNQQTASVRFLSVLVGSVLAGAQDVQDHSDGPPGPESDQDRTLSVRLRCFQSLVLARLEQVLSAGRGVGGGE